MLLLIPGLMVASILSVLAYTLSRNTIFPVKLLTYAVIGIVGIKLTDWMASAILGVVFYSFILLAVTIITFDSTIRWLFNKLLGGRSHADHDR